MPGQGATLAEKVPDHGEWDAVEPGAAISQPRKGRSEEPLGSGRSAELVRSCVWSRNPATDT